MATDRCFFLAVGVQVTTFYIAKNWPNSKVRVSSPTCSQHFHIAKEKNGYVQHRMKEEPIAARISHLILEKSAAVYICGDGNAMAKDVQNALAEVLSQKFGGDIDAAKNYI